MFEARDYLAQNFGAAVSGCVVFLDYCIGGSEALKEQDIRLVSRVEFSKILDDLNAKTLAIMKTRFRPTAALATMIRKTMVNEDIEMSLWLEERADYRDERPKLRPLELPAWAPAVPNAFSAKELKRRKVRDYFVVVSTSDNHVKRVVRSPYERDVDEDVLDRALERELTELSKQYPAPDYDIVMGRGDLQTIKNSLLTARGWTDIRTEDLCI